MHRHAWRGSSARVQSTGAHGAGMEPGSQSCARMGQVGQDPWHQWGWEQWLLWPGMRGAKQLLLPRQLHQLGSKSEKTVGIFGGKSSVAKVAGVFYGEGSWDLPAPVFPHSEEVMSKRIFLGAKRCKTG